MSQLASETSGFQIRGSAVSRGTSTACPERFQKQWTAPAFSAARAFSLSEVYFARKWGNNVPPPFNLKILKAQRFRFAKHPFTRTRSRGKMFVPGRGTSLSLGGGKVMAVS